MDQKYNNILIGYFINKCKVHYYNIRGYKIYNLFKFYYLPVY